jgi:cyclophilin family peptidyl-prolyl cis-trans isomerase
MTIDPNKKYTAKIETTAGNIELELYPKDAPNHVNSWVFLARDGYYEGVIFHRVIPGFMIQGGDPNTKGPETPTTQYGTGGNANNRLKAEFNDISHKRGIVSMARSSDPNSASSQFFIVVKDSPFLDNQYTVFGEVISGMDVADKIANAPRNARDMPNNPVHIKKVLLSQAKSTS